jgi:hypothetical protein
LKTAFALLAILIAFCRPAAAQEPYRRERATFDITSSAGVADKSTRDYFGIAFTAGLRKEWPLDKMISLHATADYLTASGKNNAPRLNLINLGGGISIYPNSIASLLMKREYEDEQAKYDSFYIDANFAWNINNNTYGKPGDMATIKLMINVKRFRLSNRLALSPKLGSQTVFFNNENLGRSAFSYFTAGVGLSLGRF